MANKKRPASKNARAPRLIESTASCQSEFEISTNDDGSRTIHSRHLPNPNLPLYLVPEHMRGQTEQHTKINGIIEISPDGEARVVCYNDAGRLDGPVDRLSVALVWARLRIERLREAIQRYKATGLSALAMTDVLGEPVTTKLQGDFRYAITLSEAIVMLELLDSVKDGKMKAFAERVECRVQGRAPNKSMLRDWAIRRAIARLVSKSGTAPSRCEIQQAYNDAEPDILSKSKLCERLEAMGLKWVPAGRKNGSD